MPSGIDTRARKLGFFASGKPCPDDRICDRRYIPAVSVGGSVSGTNLTSDSQILLYQCDCTRIIPTSLLNLFAWMWQCSPLSPGLRTSGHRPGGLPAIKIAKRHRSTRGFKYRTLADPDYPPNRHGSGTGSTGFSHK